jgi:phage tail protein X
MTITLPLPLPRDWLRLVETALTTGNYPAVAEALHSARPRDLAEVWVLLPEGIEIRLEDSVGQSTN